MKIMKTDEQALRITACLARNGGQMTQAEIVGAERLPQPTVTKLLSQLRRGGVVQTVRGRHGGYELARPSNEITVADVMKSLGRPLLVGSACSPDDPLDVVCPHVGDCGLRSVWRSLAVRITRVLEGTSLADLSGETCAIEEKLLEL
ncbi:Rrf2 family transcriptional regulator [bacterium]|nr:Rrf2 family transcriptional regulator [bacterium]MBU1073842.1 Rrf2 family transcriptional regulator [bacterium]MBU1674392.1 Rrf2 family transcriptional regulator [bacterium]